jgi:hypothetical protein
MTADSPRPQARGYRATMTQPLLIGLCGYKRSGKSTVANLLRDGFGFHMESFADPIRRAVAHMLGLYPEELERAKQEPIDWLDGLTPRQLMQTLGTEWGRAQHEELWVRSVFRRIDHAQRAAGPARPSWVIHDVRFVNEAAAIRKRGGYIVRVCRGEPPDADAHASERPLPPCWIDETLPNFRDLSALCDATGDLVQRLRIRAAA